MNLLNKLKYAMLITLCVSSNVSVAEDGVSIWRLEGVYPKIVLQRKQCEFIGKLNQKQLEVLDKIHYIAKPYNLQLTAIAIAWKESKLGKYKVRMGDSRYDRSFGIMHTVSHWRTQGMSPF